MGKRKKNARFVVTPTSIQQQRTIDRHSAGPLSDRRWAVGEQWRRGRGRIAGISINT